jgi:hypothetical protein
MIKEGVQYKVEESQNIKKQKADQVKYEKQEVNEHLSMLKQQE